MPRTKSDRRQQFYPNVQLSPVNPAENRTKMCWSLKQTKLCDMQFGRIISSNDPTNPFARAAAWTRVVVMNREPSGAVSSMLTLRVAAVLTNHRGEANFR